MNQKAIRILFFITLIIFTGCSQESKTEAFDPQSVKPMVEEFHKNWSKGTRDSNLTILSSIYANNAHYLPDQETAKNGNKEITEYWKSSLPFVKDIQLVTESLEGTKEIIYETGKGYALLVNQQDATTRDTFNFKYVNVFRLQADGNYKCVIDTYNNFPPKQ